MSQLRSIFLSFNKLTAVLEQKITSLVTSLRQWQDSRDSTGPSNWPSPALNVALNGHNATIMQPSFSQSPLEEFILWAVPKKRTSHSKKRMRMAHKYLKPKHHYTVCPKCTNLKLQHVLCGHCLKETLKLTALMRREEVENTATRD